MNDATVCKRRNVRRHNMAPSKKKKIQQLNTRNTMKNLLIFFTFILLTSFTNKDAARKLPNGHYNVILNNEFKERGLNNYEFTLENEKIALKIANKIENLELNWIDENSFIVKGLTEPSNQSNEVKEILKNGRITFQILKQEKNEYYFILGEKQDEYPIYAGKFIKTE